MYQHIKVPSAGEKIKVNADFSLQVPDNPVIPYIEGDGTGFDITPEIIEAIDAGTINFTIDQQQYLQGYLPVVVLAQYKQYGVLPAGGILPTGPGFVTKENAARVIELSKQGIR